MNVIQKTLGNILGGKKTKSRSGGWIQHGSLPHKIVQDRLGKGWFRAKDIAPLMEQDYGYERHGRTKEQARQVANRAAANILREMGDNLERRELSTRPPKSMYRVPHNIEVREKK